MGTEPSAAGAGDPARLWSVFVPNPAFAPTRLDADPARLALIVRLA